MTDLALTTTANGITAVQCSLLFRGLELDHSNYTYWVKKNIIKNPFAIEGVDYFPLSIKNYEISTEDLTKTEKDFINAPIKTPKRTRNRNKETDFVLSLEFAKKLAMLTRTEKGEAVRNYFLECEKVAQAKSDFVNGELMQELEAYRELIKIGEIRKQLNRKAQQCRERIKRANQNLSQFKYYQLTFNF